MFKWLSSGLTSTSPHASVSDPTKKEEISYFYSKVSDNNLIKDQTNLLSTPLDKTLITVRPTDNSTRPLNQAPSIPQNQTVDLSSEDKLSCYFHSALLGKDTISMGVEFTLNKHVSLNVRNLWSDNNFSRCETSVRYYSNPLTHNFKRPHGDFMSFVYSAGCTNNIDLIVGKKVYVGEDVVSCPVMMTACIGPSYFVNECKLSTLIEMSVGIEI